jgi:hypothetical protein
LKLKISGCDKNEAPRRQILAGEAAGVARAAIGVLHERKDIEGQENGRGAVEKDEAVGRGTMGADKEEAASDFFPDAGCCGVWRASDLLSSLRTPPIPSIPGARFLQGIYQLNLYVLNEPNM